MKFDYPLITEINSLIDSFFKDCYIIHFHKFKYKQLFDIKLMKIAKNEINKLKVSCKSMNINKKNNSC